MKTADDYFNEYVQLSDGERHTDEAVASFYSFSDFIHGQDIALDIETKAMDMAVEYERSGFIAGFKLAAGMIQSILFAGKDTGSIKENLKEMDI